MSKISAVANFTHRANVRHRVMTTLLVFSIVLAGGVVLFPALIPGADEKALVDTSFALVELLGFFAMLFSLSVMFFRELESRVMVLELTKPLYRWQYLLGKWLGTVQTLAWTLFYMASIMVLVIFINTMAFTPAYFYVFLYLFLEFVLLSSLAVLFSVLTTSLPASVLFNLGVFVLGHGSILIKGFAGLVPNIFLSWSLRGLYFLLPHLDYYNLKETVGEGFLNVGPHDLLLVLSYTCVYSAMALILSTMVFRQRDI